MNRKHLGWRMFGAAASLALAALYGGCRRPQEVVKPVRPVRAMQVGSAEKLGGRPWPGRARATQEVNLSFRVAGPLISGPVDVGFDAAAGDVLARIDSRDFEVRIRNIEAQLASARAVSARASQDYDLVMAAYEKNAASESEVLERTQLRDSAKADVDALNAALESAEDDLSYTYLKAPFEGTVVATFVENFETVQAKEQVVRLLDDSRIEMIIEIPENLIAMHSYVRDVKCTFDAFPGRAVDATIKEVGTEASQTTRTYPVTLIMDQPEDFKILPGMTGVARGRAEMPESDGESLVVIPASAVASATGDESHVWVIDSAKNTVHRRAVTLGRTSVHGIEVSGVAPDEWIATAGVHFLREGQEIRILGGGASAGTGEGEGDAS